ncbi:MAG: membrane protease YdiL (CAAX protease family) [Verrucomicrobiales bacterium]|jgi:membrane protease YdiL (CAAX protease family)
MMTDSPQSPQPAGPIDPDSESTEELATEPASTVWQRAKIPGIAMAALFWIVVAVFWVQHFVKQPEPPVPDRVRFGNIATQMQLMLQGKVLIAQSMAASQGGLATDLQTSLTTVEEQIEKLDGAAARSLASIQLYLEPENIDGALAKLESIKEFEPGEAAIQAMVRQQITAPGTLTQAELDELQYQMHWFAHPLLLASEDAAHPDRAKLMVNVMTLLGFGGVAILCFGGGLLLGIVLLSIVAVRAIKGKSPLRMDPSQGGSRAHIWGFIAYLAIMGSPIILVFFADENEMLGQISQVLGIAAFVVSVVAGVVIALLFSRGSFRERRHAIGLHSGRGIFREIGSGIIGYCCVLPIGLVGAAVSGVIWWITSFFPAEETKEAVTGHPIGELFFDAPVIVRIGLLLLAAVAAPLIEETMFRGVLHRGLRRSFSLPISGLIGAFCFAAVHPQDIVALPVLAALGFGFMLIREWRDSLIAPMIAHGLHNGTLMVGLWIMTM